MKTRRKKHRTNKALTEFKRLDSKEWGTRRWQDAREKARSVDPEALYQYELRPLR